MKNKAKSALVWLAEMVLLVPIQARIMAKMDQGPTRLYVCLADDCECVLLLDRWVCCPDHPGQPMTAIA